MRPTAGLLEAIRQAHELHLARADASVAFERLLEALVSMTQSARGLIAEVVPDGTGKLAALARTGSGDLGLSPGRRVVSAEVLGLPVSFGDELVGMVGAAGRCGGYDEALAEWLAPLLSTCASLIHARRTASATREILAHTHVAMARADREGRLVWVNPAFAAVWRRERGTSLFDLFPGDEIRSICRRVLESREPALLESRPLELPDHPERGVTHWDLGLAPTRGEVSGLVLTLVEVTARVRSEEKLRRSEALFRDLAGSSPAGIYATDAEGRFTYVNERWCQMAGMSPSQALGDGWRSGVHPADQDSVFSNWHRTVGPRRAWDTRYRFCDREGRVTWVQGAAAPIVDGSGNVTGYIGVNMDITETIWIEDALIASEKCHNELAQANAALLAQARADAESKALLLREVNHRVKNNLASVIGLIHAQQRCTREDLRADFQAETGKLAERIGALAAVHDLLSAGQWAPLPLVQLLDDIMRLAGRLVPEKKRMVFTVAAIDAHVPASLTNSLALLIFELATNTIKHALPGRDEVTVRVSSEWSGQGLVIRYHDDGPGWPTEVLAGQRSGLGLYLLRSITIHDLRGEFSLRNDRGALAELILKPESGVRRGREPKGEPRG